MSKIIVMFRNEDRELNMSLYDFLDEQYRNAIPILVCHVTEKEYSNMKKQIQSGCLKERLPRITEEQDRGYNKSRYVVIYNSIEENLLISDYDNPNKLGSYKIDNDGIYYEELGYQITNHPVLSRIQNYRLKVYTTESYKDIIAHYETQRKTEYKIQKKTEELIKLIGKSCKTCNTECCGGPCGKACNRWSHIIR